MREGTRKLFLGLLLLRLCQSVARYVTGRRERPQIQSANVGHNRGMSSRVSPRRVQIVALLLQLPRRHIHDDSLAVSSNGLLHIRLCYSSLAHRRLVLSPDAETKGTEKERLNYTVTSPIIYPRRWTTVILTGSLVIFLDGATRSANPFFLPPVFLKTR